VLDFVAVYITRSTDRKTSLTLLALFSVVLRNVLSEQNRIRAQKNRITVDLQRYDDDNENDYETIGLASLEYSRACIDYAFRIAQKSYYFPTVGVTEN
jgi:hypothetical protein